MDENFNIYRYAGIEEDTVTYILEAAGTTLDAFLKEYGLGPVVIGDPWWSTGIRQIFPGPWGHFLGVLVPVGEDAKVFGFLRSAWGEKPINIELMPQRKDRPASETYCGYVFARVAPGHYEAVTALPYTLAEFAEMRGLTGVLLLERVPTPTCAAEILFRSTVSGVGDAQIFGLLVLVGSEMDQVVENQGGAHFHDPLRSRFLSFKSA